MTLLAQIEEAARIVDRASVASDRWLFLFAVALILLGGVYLLIHQEKKHVIEMKELHDELRIERLENRTNRQTDQGLFLTSLSTLTGTVQEMKSVLIDHDRRMTDKHNIEVQTIAQMGGEAAVAKYIKEAK